MPLVTLEDVQDRTFDYVVVGGGSAGLVVAARLSESDPESTVLVLDAGNANLDDLMITRPGQFGFTFMNPQYDWAFKTVPQQHLNGREVMWHRGKSLGGSSAINFACWTQPYKEDINDWERLGNTGWNWESYERWNERVATFYPNEDLTKTLSVDMPKVWDKKWGEGPLKLSHPKVILDIEVKLQETLVKMGIPWASAPNRGETRGVYLVANTLDPETNGRSYSASAFFEPNAARGNLMVLTGAAVQRLVTVVASEELEVERDGLGEGDGDGKGESKLRATGVEFSHTSTGAEGKVHRVGVGKEVVLSAGALKSPQILELSGIGRPDVLAQIGVPVKLALDGVGENLQDHNFLGLTFELNADYPHDTYDCLRDPGQALKQAELFKEGKGVFMMGIMNMAFADTRTITPRAQEMLDQQRTKIDAEKHSYPPGHLEQYEMLLERMRAGAPNIELIGFPGTMSGPNVPENGKKYFSILAATNYSFNRGTAHAMSSDPSVSPEFDPRYFEHDFDLQCFVEAVKYIRKVANTAPLSDVFDSPARELNPGPLVQTDEDIAVCNLEWVKNSVGSTFHVCGSLSMLPKDKGGVVDTALKVYGTTNIRVADLSIVPLHFSAHPLATVYTIGEIAAARILGMTF